MCQVYLLHSLLLLPHDSLYQCSLSLFDIHLKTVQSAGEVVALYTHKTRASSAIHIHSQGYFVQTYDSCCDLNHYTFLLKHNKSHQGSHRTYVWNMNEFCPEIKVLERWHCFIQRCYSDWDLDLWEWSSNPSKVPLHWTCVLSITTFLPQM